MLTLVSLFAATFVSEDLACLTAGALIQRGEVDLASGIAACALGIAAGDVGLWAVGRVFGETALEWPWVAAHVGGRRFADLRAWLSRHAGAAIVGSRFIPGTRLPTYMLAGFTRLPLATFALWTMIGVTLWTPVPILFSASLGDLLDGALWSSRDQSGMPWLTTIAIAAGALHGFRTLLRPRPARH